jgi:hypothetical protein
MSDLGLWAVIQFFSVCRWGADWGYACSGPIAWTMTRGTRFRSTTCCTTLVIPEKLAATAAHPSLWRKSPLGESGRDGHLLSTGTGRIRLPCLHQTAPRHFSHAPSIGKDAHASTSLAGKSKKVSPRRQTLHRDTPKITRKTPKNPRLSDQRRISSLASRPRPTRDNPSTSHTCNPRPALPAQRWLGVFSTSPDRSGTL